MIDPTPLTSKRVAELRAAFANALPGRLQQIHDALQRGDLSSVQAIAHTLSGSSATFGCRRIGSAAAILEDVCRANDVAASLRAYDALGAAAEADVPQVCPAHEDEAHATAPSPLVLLVDDDTLLVGMLAHALEAAGFRVATAGSAKEALAFLHFDHLQPDLAVLDIAMPGMSGLELAGQLGDVPYMILSASRDAEIATQAAQAGAVGFLLKPITSAQLLPAVRAALARAADIYELRAAEQRLTQALHEGRETGMAVGVLMERYRIDRHGALRMLRSHARSSQRKLNDVATELLQASETLNALTPPKPDQSVIRAHAPDRRK